MNQGTLPAHGPVDVIAKSWFLDVTVGQRLRPIPLWNQIERGPNCLPALTEVLGIEHATSETGVLFKVRTKGGAVCLLDAGWFEQPTV